MIRNAARWASAYRLSNLVQLISDDFNRPDETLTTPWVTVRGASWSLASNQVSYASTSGGVVIWGSEALSSDDVYAEIDVLEPGARASGVVLRHIDPTLTPNTWYEIFVQYDTDVLITKDGTLTVATIPWPTGAGRLRAELEQNHISVFKDNVLLGEYSDPNPTYEGRYAGMVGQGALTALQDNFEAGIITTLYTGVVTTPGDGYQYYTFNRSGYLPAIGTAEYIVVGGGGAGGTFGGGGGGGVEVGTANFTGLTPVWVGVGGIPGGNGASLSKLGNIIAYGGGVGGPYVNASGPAPGGDGGSGGGGGSSLSAAGVGGTSNATHGNPGGLGDPPSANAAAGGGGGGGAGSAGGNSPEDSGGNGGDGYLWLNGERYGPGGGGGGYITAGTGGLGGGGNGGLYNVSDATAGQDGKGAGGGGSYAQVGGTSYKPGGRGVVIARIPI